MHWDINRALDRRPQPYQLIFCREKKKAQYHGVQILANHGVCGRAMVCSLWASFLKPAIPVLHLDFPGSAGLCLCGIQPFLYCKARTCGFPLRVSFAASGLALLIHSHVNLSHAHLNIEDLPSPCFLYFFYLPPLYFLYLALVAAPCNFAVIIRSSVRSTRPFLSSQS